MDGDVKRRAAEIMGKMQCDKGFKCVASGFAPRARYFGLDDYLQCPEGGHPLCQFGLSFGYSYLCSCPLQLYLAKTLKKI